MGHMKLLMLLFWCASTTTWLNLAFAQQYFYETKFLPASYVISVTFDKQTLSWSIVTQYSAASAYPTGIVAVPIMYFPTTGNTQLTAGANPCILDGSAGLCCLLDFSMMYTTVALYDWVKTSGLTPETCNNASFYTEAMRNLSNASGPGDEFVTGVLKRFPNASTTQLVPSAQSYGLGYHLTQTIVDFRLLGGVPHNWHTFCGILWVAYTPDIPSKLLFSVSQTVLHTDVTVLPVQLFFSANTQPCVLTPQGICMVCTNPLPANAFFVYTDKGFKSRNCDFRCSNGTFLAAATLQACQPCTPVSCPAGSYTRQCTPTTDAKCVQCAQPLLCPSRGYQVTQCLQNGTIKYNGCQRCNSAPPLSLYTSACLWQCRPYYTLTITNGVHECIFTPGLEEGAQLAIECQMYVSNLVPADQQLTPFEPVFDSATFSETVAVSLALDTENVIIISELRVNSTVVEPPAVIMNTEAAPVSLRRLLQVKNASVVSSASLYYTLVQVYIWIPIAEDTDMLQTLMELVNNNDMSRDVSAALGTPVNVTFYIDPSYVQLAILLALLKAKGKKIPEVLLHTAPPNSVLNTNQLGRGNALLIHWAVPVVAVFVELLTLLKIQYCHLQEAERSFV